MTVTLDTLGTAKYLLITSYRRDGRAVATPVWVVRDGDGLGVWSATDSGKVKRVRRDGTVLIGVCDVRGTPTGEQVPGRARLLDREGSDRVRALIADKYGLMGRLGVLGSRLRRGRDGSVGISITLA